MHVMADTLLLAPIAVNSPLASLQG